MITYPLTPPTAFATASAKWTPVTYVQSSSFEFTGKQTISALPGSFWQVDLEIPVRTRADADAVEGFLLALNGPEGTFYYRDILRPNTKGTASGAWTVAAGCVANSTTLPTSGTGALTVGDWLQVGTQLLRVTQVNVGSVDVFPKLRQAYTAGTAITYTNPKGLFRLRSAVPFDIGQSRNFGPYTVSLVESV